MESRDVSRVSAAFALKYATGEGPDKVLPQSFSYVLCPGFVDVCRPSLRLRRYGLCPRRVVNRQVIFWCITRITILCGVIAVTMAMVTARVDAERKREAEAVLKRHGLTYSDVIRDLTNYLADTGELPEFERITLDLVRRREMERKLAIIEMFANAELPAVEGGLSDEEIVEQERLRKAGEPW